MNSFKQYVEDAWGHSERDLFQQVETNIQTLERDLRLLTGKLSHGSDPVAHAAERALRDLEILRNTNRTAWRKNVENPEMSDHPPVTILPQ